VTATVQRGGLLVCALFVATGLVLLQALIGGRALLFAFPGYCFIAAAGLVGLISASRSKTRADSICLYATAIFFGYIFIRALASPGYFARPDLFSALGALAVYGLTVTTLTSSTVRSGVFMALLTFALVHVVIGLIQFSRGDNFMLIPFLERADYSQRASGFYVCPNHLAGLLEVVGIFGVSLTFWGRWPIWARVLLAYATIVCYVGLALTGSRGGYLSGMASLLVFGALSLVVVRASRPGRLLKFGAIAMLALTSFAVGSGLLIRQSDFLGERAGNIIDTKNMRVDLWRAALEQWRIEPVFGTGSGTYRFYGRQFRAEQMQNDPIDVHNDYLQLLCEYGLVGVVGFLLFFFIHLRRGWRSLKHFASKAAAGREMLLSNRLALNIAALAALAAYVIHSAVDFNLHIPANAMLLALVFGILAHSGTSHDSGARGPDTTKFPRIATAFLGGILLIQCVRLFPAEYYGERARTALRDENPAESIVLVSKALLYERQNPDLFFYLGRAMLARAHQSEQTEARPAFYERAVAAFEEAYRLAPLDGTYPLNLAFTYDEMGRFEEAESMFSVARSRDPRSTAVSQLYQSHRESWGETESSLNEMPAPKDAN